MTDKELLGSPSPNEGGQAGADRLGSRSEPRNKPGANGSQAALALHSEALCAAGCCVAAFLAGFEPTKIELRPSQSGRWLHEVGGVNVEPGSTIGREIFMTGALARRLARSAEPDVIAMLEHVVVAVLFKVETQADAMRLVERAKTTMALVLQHESIIREIAGRLVAAKAVSGKELAAHLARFCEGARR
jgi:hypothetical protein